MTIEKGSRTTEEESFVVMAGEIIIQISILAVVEAFVAIIVVETATIENNSVVLIEEVSFRFDITILQQKTNLD